MDDETVTGSGESVDEGGDAPDPEAARERVVDAFERTAELYGANRSVGRLYGVLFFADEPRSLDDLVEESGYAKSTVSTAMRTLSRFHLARRRSVPGEGKKAYYEAERDFTRVVREFLRNEVRREIEIMGEALDEAAAELEAAGANDDYERVRELKRVYDLSERLIGVIGRLPIHRIESLLDRFGSGSDDEFGE